MDNPQEFHTVRGYQLLEQNSNLLTSAMEDYLEMIYRKSLEKNEIRINTLSESLNVTASSVTKMVQKLNRLGLLSYEKYGAISLTDDGKQIGIFLFQRHKIIELFLKNLGVTDSLLIETELIEHSFKVGTVHKLNVLNKFLGEHPEILNMYQKYLKYNI